MFHTFLVTTCIWSTPHFYGSPAKRCITSFFASLGTVPLENVKENVKGFKGIPERDLVALHWGIGEENQPSERSEADKEHPLDEQCREDYLYQLDARNYKVFKVVNISTCPYGKTYIYAISESEMTKEKAEAEIINMIT